MATPTFATERLDQLEAALPPIPARVLRLQRTVAGAVCDRITVVTDTVVDSTRNFLDTARISGKTVTGQARAAGTDVVGNARTGVREVVGQAQRATGTVARSARTGARTVAGQADAQGKKLSAAATGEATRLLDSAIDAVDETPGSGKPYEQWSKAELLKRAQELDIDGRSGLSKGQLIAALRAG